MLKTAQHATLGGKTTSRPQAVHPNLKVLRKITFSGAHSEGSDCGAAPACFFLLGPAARRTGLREPERAGR